MIKKNIFIVRLCIVMFLIFLPVALPADLSAQTEDVTPPVLVDLSFTPATIDVSGGDQDVVFTWNLTDDLVGIGDGYTYLRISSPSGEQSRDAYVSSSNKISGTMNDGVFETTVTFPQYSEAGTWQIQYVCLRDALGNSQYLYTADLAAFNTDLAVTGTSDTFSPVLVDLSFTPTTIDISGGDQDVVFTWNLTDDLVGVGDGYTYLYMISPSGQQSRDAYVYSTDLKSGTMNDGVFETTVTFPQYSEAGTWQIQYVCLRDALGNSQYLFYIDLDAMGFNTDLTVTGTSDTTSPELVDLSFTPTIIDVNGGDQDVVFTWNLTDDLVGVGDGYTYLRINSPSGEQSRDAYVYSTDLKSGTMNDGVFETTITFPQYSETGTWKIQYVRLRDALVNSQYLYTDDLADMEINTNLIVSAPPTADAGLDQTVDEVVTVTLDASNSSDPDDGIASYLWTQTAGTTVTLSDATAAQPTFTAPDVGPGGVALIFELTVTDYVGLQSTDTCIVNVSWLNIVPIAVAGSDQTVGEGVTVTLDASNSSDADDGVASYLWEQTSGTTVTLSDETAVQPAFTAPDVGPDGESLTFQLTVTDNGGLQAQDTCIVSVLNNTPPDIPTAVSPANELIFAEGPVTLKTSPFSDPNGDTHLQTHWLVRRADSVYYRSDYDPSFDQLVTAVSLTEYTVSGLEPGLKYVWKAGYVDSGSGDTSWSKEYTFKIGTSEADSSVCIESGTEAPDFKMVSFIQWPDDPVSTSVFGDEMGESYDKDFRMGTYDPTSGSGGYVEYGSNLIIEPGRAYWLLARDGLDITVNGVPVSGIHNIEVGLLYNSSNENGWNMIVCPNNADYDWENVEVVEYDESGNIVYGPTAISVLGDPNDYIDKRLWRWDNGSYYSDTSLMEKYEGYWVKVKKANLFLRFPVSAQASLANPSTMFACLLSEGKRWIKGFLTPQVAIADSGDSPPPPMGDFSVSSGGVGGDVGCFIATAAYGSPMEGHVKTLRDFRDSYLLSFKVGRMIVKTYNRYSPPLADLIARHDTLKTAVRIGLLPLVAISYPILNYGPTITAIMLVFTPVLPISFASSYRRRMKG